MFRKLKEGFGLLFWNPIIDKIYEKISYHVLWHHAWNVVRKGLEKENAPGIGIPLTLCDGGWELLTAFETNYKTYHLYYARFKYVWCVVQCDGIIVDTESARLLFGDYEEVLRQFCDRHLYHYMIELAATGQIKKLKNYIGLHWRDLMKSINRSLETGILKAEEL